MDIKISSTHYVHERFLFIKVLLNNVRPKVYGKGLPYLFHLNGSTVKSPHTVVSDSTESPANLLYMKLM